MGINAGISSNSSVSGETISFGTSESSELGSVIVSGSFSDSYSGSGSGSGTGKIIEALRVRICLYSVDVIKSAPDPSPRHVWASTSALIDEKTT